ELSFHRHETEVRGANFHFIATKRKFAARTFISSPRNGSSRHELSFDRHETEVRGTNFRFIPTKWKFTCCRDHKESVIYRSLSRQVQARGSSSSLKFPLEFH